MIKNNRIILLALFLFISCNKSQNSDVRNNPYAFLMTSNLNSYSLEFVKSSNKFREVYGLDVPIYKIANNDTIMKIQFSGNDNSEPYWVSWEITLLSLDSIFVSRFLNSQMAAIVTRYSDEDRFGIYNYKNHELYLGQLTENKLIISRPIMK